MKYSPPATLNEMLQSRVEQHPDKLALIFKDGRWSYAEFSREVDRVANGFIRIGVKRGDRIAFVLPNCAEFLFAVFAVTKIGAVFVPLNPQYTAEEAEYVLQHSEASIILTSPELLPLIDAVRDKLPDLKQVIVTGDGGTRESAVMERVSLRCCGSRLEYRHRSRGSRIDHLHIRNNRSSQRRDAVAVRLRLCAAHAGAGLGLE